MRASPTINGIHYFGIVMIKYGIGFIITMPYIVKTYYSVGLSVVSLTILAYLQNGDICISLNISPVSNPPKMIDQIQPICL
jgi:hypothetical protein